MNPTLLLLPGLMCDAAVWAPQISVLSGHARCVVPDWGPLDSITAMAEHVLATAPTRTFALAGHSMGGRVALEVMRLAPARVQRLALLDTGTQPLPAGEAGEKERAGRLALLALAHTEGMRTMGRQWLRGMVHPDVLSTALFDSVLDVLERSSPDQFAAQINALLTRPDAAAVLPIITCPTLVLCGREDYWSPPEQHAQIAHGIAGATLHVIEHCGHMPTVEQPAELNRALVEWLQG